MRQKVTTNTGRVTKRKAGRYVFQLKQTHHTYRSKHFTSVKWNWSIAEKLWSNKATRDQCIAGGRLISSGQPYRNNRPDYCGLQVICQCKISEFAQSGLTMWVTHYLIGQIQNNW